MQSVGKAIQEGAFAYLGRQVRTMIPLVILITVGLFFLYKAQYQSVPNVDATSLGIGVALAFLLGVTASYLAGYVGMVVALKANMRVAHAALSSFKNALEIAFRAGAVSGMFTVGLGLLGATITFMVYQENAMFVLVGFGFGGSLAALLMRVGGGIFTKAADVGADLVGKVEAGIPEDDPRNAATIADNVGDNVGDCAGMAADVFESYEVTLVAAIILAAAVGGTLAANGLVV
ncbi:MAG: sodium/proton-translocating pyrophosphatase [bacterium]|nr:sodium/proton-translocating pyrophosphatase [bacterium]